MNKVKTNELKGRPGMKRFQFNMDMRIFDGIVRAAQARYCPISRWIVRAIIEKLKKEEEFFKGK